MNSSSQSPPGKEGVSFKIFVGGLEPEVTEDDLTEYFSKFGKVVERIIKVDRTTRKNRGFAFVGFKSPEAVDKVLEVDEHRISGKKIDCKRAMTKEEAFTLNKTLKESVRKIFVSNIPKDATKSQMAAFFSEFGPILEINLMFKKKDTGFCYVTFRNEQDAVDLITRKLIEFRGQQLEVKRAIPKELKDTEEELKAKVLPNQQFPYPPPPKHRHSFDTPMNYHPAYSNHVHSPGMGPHHKMSSPGGYPMVRVMPSPQGNPNLIPHDAIPPYPRQGQMSAHMYDDPRFSSKYTPYPVPAFAGPSGGDSLAVERQAHRNRVMSEQHISTYKPFAGPGPSSLYPAGLDVRSSQQVKRYPAHGQSFSHIEDQIYPTQASPVFENRRHFSSSVIELHDGGGGGKQPERGNISPTQRLHHPPPPDQEELGFQENDFNFKNQFPKESGPQSSPSMKPKEIRPTENLASPKRPDAAGASSAQKRLNKSAIIKQLEEEIKATKERLRQLEEALKVEYETVEEHESDREQALSDKSS